MLRRVAAAAGVTLAAGAVAAEPSVTPCETSPKIFLSVAFGLGGVSRVGDVPPLGGFYSWRVQLGQRLGHGLHLVEEFNSIASGSTMPFPSTTSEEQGSFGMGLRWTPFKPNPTSTKYTPLLFFPGDYVDIQAFYFTAVLGANIRDRVTQTSATQATDDTALSPMASLAVGLFEIQGRDWTFGPEFREQVAHYDGHFQRGWMAVAAIHLNKW